MKRTVALLVFLMLVLVQFGAFAEMGVQLISGPEEETEPVSLDDFKLNADARIDGYGILTGTSFDFVGDLIRVSNGIDYHSGEEAEFALLRMDILNTEKTSRNFLAACEVSVIYDDAYEYGGWCYQYNYDKHKERVLDSNDFFGIDPMYTGHYCFGCTLPNAVVNSKAPLKMIIKLDGNEITYNIRK